MVLEKHNLPLWMIEGLAEYLSIGGIDSHTAMWMRDAVMRDDVPSLKDLRNPQYFPYRYGQAFWAFLTGLKGDDIIQPFFVATARAGLDVACMAAFFQHSSAHFRHMNLSKATK